jgi:hypothetical protein
MKKKCDLCCYPVEKPTKLETGDMVCAVCLAIDQIPGPADEVMAYCTNLLLERMTALFNRMNAMCKWMDSNNDRLAAIEKKLEENRKRLIENDEHEKRREIGKILRENDELRGK